MIIQAPSVLFSTMYEISCSLEARLLVPKRIYKLLFDITPPPLPNFPSTTIYNKMHTNAYKSHTFLFLSSIFGWIVPPAHSFSRTSSNSKISHTGSMKLQSSIKWLKSRVRLLQWSFLIFCRMLLMMLSMRKRTFFENSYINVVTYVMFTKKLSVCSMFPTCANFMIRWWICECYVGLVSMTFVVELHIVL